MSLSYADLKSFLEDFILSGDINASGSMARAALHYFERIIELELSDTPQRDIIFLLLSDLLTYSKESVAVNNPGAAVMAAPSPSSPT